MILNKKKKATGTKKKQKKQSKELSNNPKKKRLFGKKQSFEELQKERDKAFDDAIANNTLDALVYTPEKISYYIKKNQHSKLSLSYYKELYITQMRKQHTILIRMFLRNKKTVEFFIANQKPLFTYAGGTYIIDSSLVGEDISSGFPCLFYHQDCSLPLDISIDLETIEDAINQDVRLNIHPPVLHALVEQQTIGAVMAGGVLDKQLKLIVLFIVILLVLMVVNTIAMLINFLM